MNSLEFLIQTWKDALSQYRRMMPSAQIFLLEETIRQLEYLKTLAPEGRFTDHSP